MHPVASLRYELGESEHEYEFVNGALLWPPARGIQDVFGEHTACYSYFDGSSPASVLEAIRSLEDLVLIHGPFDGVIGFSQGAVLAATLLVVAHADAERGPRKMPFRCAVFLCGGLPFDYSALSEGVVRQIEPTEHQPPLIRTPVVNCWAANDTDYPGMGPPLAKLCIAEKNLEVIHSAGHGVPAEGEDLLRLHAAIVDMITQVGRG